MISSNGLPSHPPMCASTSSSSTVTSVPASRANAWRGLVRAPERRGVDDERLEIHHEEPACEQGGLLDASLRQRRVPLLAAGARPWLALPAEIGLTVPDQVQNAIRHAGEESVVDRLGSGGGWVARQWSAYPSTSSRIQIRPDASVVRGSGNDPRSM